MDQYKNRNSSIELLRITSIFFIVLGHACRHGIIDNSNYNMQLANHVSNVMTYILSAGGWYCQSYIYFNYGLLLGKKRWIYDQEVFKSFCD